MPLSVLGIAFGLYIFLNFCRALRFRVLLAQASLPFWSLFPITLYHNFLTRTLPFMTGEISYVAMLRRYLQQPVSEGIGSLLGARLFELIFVILGGGIGLLTTAGPLADQRPLLLAAVGLGVATSGAGLYLSGTFCRGAAAAWRWMERNNPWKGAGKAKRVEGQLEAVALQLDRIRRPRIFVPTLLLSLFTYGTSVSFHLLLLHATGVEQHTGILLVVISIVILVLWFPFSVSGFGVVEGGWTFGLVLFAGLDLNRAVSLGLFLHGCQVIVTVLSGLIGYLLLPAQGRDTRGDRVGRKEKR